VISATFAFPKKLSGAPDCTRSNADSPWIVLTASARAAFLSTARACQGRYHGVAQLQLQLEDARLLLGNRAARPIVRPAFGCLGFTVPSS
jgi:hypothetical protein